VEAKTYKLSQEKAERRETQIRSRLAIAKKTLANEVLDTLEKPLGTPKPPGSSHKLKEHLKPNPGAKRVEPPDYLAPTTGLFRQAVFRQTGLRRKMPKLGQTNSKKYEILTLGSGKHGEQHTKNSAHLEIVRSTG